MYTIVDQMEGQHGSLHEYENHYPNVDDLLCPVGMENPTCTLKAFPQENMFIVEVRVQDRAEYMFCTTQKEVPASAFKKAAVAIH